MKFHKLFSFALAAFFLAASFIALPSARADQGREIFLLDIPHRDINGIFLDSSLNRSLLPTGKLGKLVFTPIDQPRSWLIDGALIEDVQTLSQSNISAQNWLEALTVNSSQDPVFALPYGHPDITPLNKLAVKELSYYFEASRIILQKNLGREVQINHSINWSAGTSRIPTAAARAYLANRNALQLMRTLVPASQLNELRSKLAFLLTPGLSYTRQLLLAKQTSNAVNENTHKLRIVPGKYHLTSSKEKVPLTLVNDFPTPITVNLQLIPLNSRIQISDIHQVILEARSKTQILLPVSVIASGSTSVIAQFINSQGERINESVLLTLSASVITPAVAWFTTGAAILLFLAALTQSIRRIRRSRK